MSESSVTKGWKLVNMKVPLDVLERIDVEARRLRLSRTGYILWRSDPKDWGGMRRSP